MGISACRPHDDTGNQGRIRDRADRRGGLRRSRRSAGQAVEERRHRRGRARDPLGRRARCRDARFREPAGCRARQRRAGRLEGASTYAIRDRERGDGSIACRRDQGGPTDFCSDGTCPPRGNGDRQGRCGCEESFPPAGGYASCAGDSDAGHPVTAHARLGTQGLPGAARAAPEGRAATSSGHEPRPSGRPYEAAARSDTRRSARPGQEGRRAASTSTAAEEGLT
jgi:hypothetical protein